MTALIVGIVAFGTGVACGFGYKNDDSSPTEGIAILIVCVLIAIGIHAAGSS